MKQSLYVGRHSQTTGISTYLFDDRTGMLEFVDNSDLICNSTYLAHHDKTIYSVIETPKLDQIHGGGVAAFSVSNSNKHLKLISKEYTRGSEPCHLTIDEAGKRLFCANYSEGSFTGFPLLKDGKIKPLYAHIEHKGHSVNPERQEQSHVHYTSFTPDNRYLCVVDLGTDTLIAYSVVTKTPIEIHRFSFPAGFGPRHLVFSNNGTTLYVIGELSCEILVLNYDAEQGFSFLQKISSLPPETKFSATFSGSAIKRSTDGKFLYVTNRGHNTVSVFSINHDDGKLTFIQSVSTFGDHPRELSLDLSDQYVFVANRNSDSIVIFNRNSESGMLTYHQIYEEIEKPTCLLFTSSERN